MLAPNDLEHVLAETISVGDYVCDVAPGGPARCVIAKARARSPRDRSAGWWIALADGETAWWPKRARVWRRRFGEPRAA